MISRQAPQSPSSPFLNTGPTNSSALLTSAALLGLGAAGSEQSLQALFLLITLLPAAFTLALIGLIEAIATGELLALKERQEFDVNQEFFGQGLSQTLSAFFQGFPGSGSFSRSALIEQTGGQTRLANVFFGLVTAAAILTVPQWLDRSPIAPLAGLLLYVGWHLIDFKRIHRVIDTSRMGLSIPSSTAIFPDSGNGHKKQYEGERYGIDPY
jgi:MFS superfamily sulfate permease-like transporter